VRSLYETVPAGVKRIRDAFLSRSFACNVNAAAGCSGTDLLDLTRRGRRRAVVGIRTAGGMSTAA